MTHNHKSPSMAEDIERARRDRDVVVVNGVSTTVAAVRAQRGTPVVIDATQNGEPATRFTVRVPNVLCGGGCAVDRANITRAAREQLPAGYWLLRIVHVPVSGGSHE